LLLTVIGIPEIDVATEANGEQVVGRPIKKIEVVVIYDVRCI
jgi:hypothetical protein